MSLFLDGMRTILLCYQRKFKRAFKKIKRMKMKQKKVKCLMINIFVAFFTVVVFRLDTVNYNGGRFNVIKNNALQFDIIHISQINENTNTRSDSSSWIVFVNEIPKRNIFSFLSE